MELLLRHERGELGPKTIDEWAILNGDESLLIWMLRSLEKEGVERIELVAVASPDWDSDSNYLTELRPL